MALARRMPVEIISVDSAQIYRGMNIGTAKPTHQEQRDVRHHLIDICDPADIYSAARFRDDATRLCGEIVSRGRTPLLVGGSMLYFKALRGGLSAMPSADPAVRSRIQALADAEGWTGVHERLQVVDPVSAARIHPNDPQRLQRALEVWEISGRSMTDLRAASPPGASEFPMTQFAIWPEARDVLHATIAARFDAMLAAGLIDEVAALRDRRDLRPDLPAIKSVGYRQVWGYLAGEYDAGRMREKGLAATRQLAKRQITWLRRWPDVHRLGAPDPVEVLDVLQSRAVD